MNTKSPYWKEYNDAIEISSLVNASTARTAWPVGKFYTLQHSQLEGAKEMMTIAAAADGKESNSSVRCTWFMFLFGPISLHLDGCRTYFSADCFHSASSRTAHVFVIIRMFPCHTARINQHHEIAYIAVEHTEKDRARPTLSRATRVCICSLIKVPFLSFLFISSSYQWFAICVAIHNNKCPCFSLGRLRCVSSVHVIVRAFAVYEFSVWVSSLTND